jgi:hypothetical protein
MEIVDRGAIWTVNICKNSERRWRGAIFPGVPLGRDERRGSNETAGLRGQRNVRKILDTTVAKLKALISAQMIIFANVHHQYFAMQRYTKA